MTSKAAGFYSGLFGTVAVHFVGVAVIWAWHHRGGAVAISLTFAVVSAGLALAAWCLPSSENGDTGRE
jgi:hypothetical protein